MSDGFLHRVVKNGVALTAGQGINVLTQLLLPPAFIAAYGLQGYGQWLVLSAAIGFLTTLDFGLSTYTLNALTGHYHRGEMEQFHRLQSVTIRLLVGIVLATATLALLVFAVPLAQILNVTVPELEVSLTVYLLALQILLGIVFGQLVGLFRTLGKAHRGQMWSNGQKAVLLLVTITLTLAHTPFWGIALGQLLTLPATILLSLGDLKRVAPEAYPRVRYWDSRLAKLVLAPSAFFGLFALNNFLVFQAPLLILNYLLGAQAVVVFSVGRTLFSLVRQGAASLQIAILPEITRIYGIGDALKLARLYRISESIALAWALVANVGMYLLAPVVLWIWLQRPDLYRPTEYLLLMVVSVAMCTKEYMLAFQYATNNHTKPAIALFIIYVLFCLTAIPATWAFGLLGLLTVWALAEVAQVGAGHVFNRQLLAAAGRINLAPVIRLGFVLLPFMVLASCLNTPTIPDALLFKGAIAVVAMLVLTVVSYFLFNLGSLWKNLLRDRLVAR